MLVAHQPALAQCGDPAALLTSAENDIVSFFLADAERTLDEAVEAFGCSTLAEPVELARLFQARGMVRVLRDEDGAPELAASRALAPELWNADYGEQSRALWSEAQLDGQGTLEVKGLPKGHGLAVDGQVVGDQRSFAVGPHLLQVLEGERPYYARTVSLGPDAPVVVSIPASGAVGAEVSEASPAVATGRGVKKPWVYTGVAGLLAGGALVGAAKLQDGAMRNAETLNELDAAYSRQKTLGYSGYAVAAGGVVSLGLAVAL